MNSQCERDTWHVVIYRFCAVENGLLCHRTSSHSAMLVRAFVPGGSELRLANPSVLSLWSAATLFALMRITREYTDQTHMALYE